MNGVGPLHYYTPWLHSFNCLSSDPNGGHMQMLGIDEVDVETYHFEVHKTIGVSNSRVIFRVHYSWINGDFPLHYCTP